MFQYPGRTYDPISCSTSESRSGARTPQYWRGSQIQTCNHWAGVIGGRNYEAQVVSDWA